MKSLKQLVVEQTTLSPLMAEREKIDTSDIKKFNPNGIHINAIDIMKDTDGKDFYVFTMEEYEDKFAFSGEVLNRVFNAWLYEYNGDLSAVNEELSNNPVGVKLGDAYNKNKQRYTTVSVIEE